MTRSLNGSLTTELATDKLNPVDLIYIGVSTGYYYTDHYKDITYNSNTYLASSLFLGMNEVNESSELGVSSLTLKFTGADQTIISLLLNNDYMDKTVNVYRAFLDQSQVVINYPFLLFEGRIENFNIEETDTTSEILISVASHWADFEKVRNRRTNTNSQKLFFTSDKGFNYASQTTKDIKWGRA